VFQRSMDSLRRNRVGLKGPSPLTFPHTSPDPLTLLWPP
jgi:hypothetical protein